MNNRELYIDVMSGIQPSENVIERIMDMTDQKKKFRPRKGLIAVLVVIAMLAFGGITANAATDGAVAEYISNTVKAIVKTDENGEKYAVIEGDFQDDAGEIVVIDEETGEEEIAQYKIPSEDDSVEWSSDSDASINAK